MKKAALALLFVLAWGLGFSQNQEQAAIDSLKHLLPISSKDTSRVLALVQLSNAYNSYRPDSSIYYAQQALVLARKIKYPKGEFEALFRMGFTLGMVGNYPRALDMLLKALRIAEKHLFGEGKARVLNRLGNIYRDAGDYSKAVFFHQRARLLFDSLQLHSQSAGAQNLLARDYFLLNKTDSALYYSQLAYENTNRWNVEWMRSPNFLLMGTLQLELRNFPLALDYLQKSVYYSYTQQNFYSTQAYLLIAKMYQQTNQPDSTILYAQKALADAQQAKLFREIGEACQFLASFYGQKNASLALQYQQTALAAKDSLYNFGNLIALQNQTAFDEEERQYEIEIAQAAWRNQVRSYALLAGFGMALLIAFILYRNSREKQKANIVLEDMLSNLKTTQAHLERKNRDLEIEAALERVRSRTMAMQKSDELLEVIKTVFEQFQYLGFRVDMANFNFLSNDKDWHMWLATPEKAYPEVIHVPYIRHPLFDRPIETARKGLDFMSDVLTYEESNIVTNHFLETTILKNDPPDKKQYYAKSKGLARSIVFMKNIALTISNVDAIPYTDQENATLRRFAHVFEQSYTRFLDLKKAEAQAEKAKLDLIQIQTEKKRAEDALVELRLTQAQLIQSEKLASLGELTAGIAHEIQNPLNFVNNFSEVSAEMLNELKEELAKGETEEAHAIADDLKTNLQKITHHGQRASSIVKSMLEHARQGRDAMHRVSTDINALADEYLRLAYHGWRAKDNTFNAKMETHFDPDLPLVSVIPQDIGRVLLNLINNAFYAVNERSKKGENGYEPTVSITTQIMADNQVQISVKDNGSGIPAHIKDKIFQPFFTTKPTGQGTGLGLSLAYDIVTKGHGGTIEVKTKEGKGTEFMIHMPG